MATPDRTGAISVTIGGQVRFQMKSKKRIREAFNENDRVVQVLADATDPSTLILIGRSAGTSRLEVTDVDGAKESYLIVVQRDVEMLRNLIRRTVPTALVEITPIGDSGTSIIVSGYVAAENDRETIRQLAEALGLRVAVNTVSVGGGGNVPHVQLDVTLAKVDRTRARSRGANFIVNGGTVSAGSILGGITSVQPGNIGTSVPNGLGLGAQPQAPIFQPTSTANLIFGLAPSNFQFLLAALKSEGLAKLVAAPTLVARSGEEAELLIGGQVPVISAAAGINGPGVTYRPVGTELRFLPVVYGNGKIHLTVSPRVTRVNNAQALTTSFGTSPAFEEQRMTTSVIVEPGQTFAIGGLIQTTSDATITKIPHLGDLPYLGPLFSYATQTEEELELIVLLTPRLVDPADCSQMPKAMPGSETRKPDDYEFYLEAILEAPRGQRQIWNGGEYVPAWKSGPSANIYPCAGGNCGAGAYGGCGDGKCGPANGNGRPMMAPPTSLPAREPPTVRADPLVAPPSSLLDPDRPDRRTAELPQK
jgi:pilus assembly protein CpaC